MSFDKDELAKLSPEQRLKRLKELEQKLEEERRKDATEIGVLIKKSMEEIKTDQLAERVAPRPSEVDITRLFSEEERAVREPRRRKEDEPSVPYVAQEQLASDYTSLKKLLYYELSPGSISREQRQEIEAIRDRLDTISYRSKSSAEQINILLSASREALHKVRRYSQLE